MCEVCGLGKCRNRMPVEQQDIFSKCLHLLMRTVSDTRKGWDENGAGWGSEAGIEDLRLYRVRASSNSRESGPRDVLILSIAEMRNPMVPVFLLCKITEPVAADLVQSDALQGALVELQLDNIEEQLFVSCEMAVYLLELGTKFRFDRVRPSDPVRC